MTNIYKQAAQTGITFVSDRGNLLPNDLFKIPLESNTRTSVNGLYVQLEAEFEASTSKGLVSKPSPKSAVIKLKMDLLRDVYETRSAELVERAAQDKRSKDALLELERLDQAILNSKTKELDGKSTEELLADRQKLLDSVNKG